MSQVGSLSIGSSPEDPSIAKEFNTNSGSAIPIMNTIVIIGDSNSPITTSGSGNAVEIDISNSSESNVGTIQIASTTEARQGTNSTKAVVPSALRSKLGSQTENGIAYGGGPTVPTRWLAEASNGQIPIGSTGNAPILGNLTSTGGTVAITNGPGTINLESMGGGGVGISSILVNDGTSVTPIGGIVSIIGNVSDGITSSAIGNILTLNISNSSESNVGTIQIASTTEARQGTNSTKAVVPSALRSKLGSQTENGIAYGGGPTVPTRWLAEASNGQIPIGSTGNAPVLSTITAGEGISIANSPGNITISGSSSAIPWTTVTTVPNKLQTSTNNGYIFEVDSGSVLLPSVFEVGDILILHLAGVDIVFCIPPNITVRYGDQSVGGLDMYVLLPKDPYGSITLRGRTANTVWSVESSIGNFELELKTLPTLVPNPVGTF